MVKDKTISHFIDQLDRNKESLDERVNDVNEIVNIEGTGRCDNFFVNHFDNYYNPHITVNKPTSESEVVCKQLERMADYILYNKENLAYNDESEYPIETKNERFNNKKDKKISSYEASQEACADKFEKDLREEKVKQYEVQLKYEITESDLKKYPQLRSLQNDIDSLRRVVEKDKIARKKMELDEDNTKEYENDLLTISDSYKIKSMMADLKRTQLDLKKCLTKPIQFNSVDGGRSKYTFWDNTGYYDCEGNYIEITNNKLELSDYRHISELIKHYSGIKEIVGEDLNNDWRYLLWELEDLIDRTELTDVEFDVLVWTIDNCSAKTILELIKDKYDLDYTTQYIYNLINKVIPKKIVETYLDDKLNYVYTHKLKGKYKTCSKCGEVKLAIDRYFGSRKASKDGLKYNCKACQ